MFIHNIPAFAGHQKDRTFLNKQKFYSLEKFCRIYGNNILITVPDRSGNAQSCLAFDESDLYIIKREVANRKESNESFRFPVSITRIDGMHFSDLKSLAIGSYSNLGEKFSNFSPGWGNSFIHTEEEISGKEIEFRQIVAEALPKLPEKFLVKFTQYRI